MEQMAWRFRVPIDPKYKWYLKPNCTPIRGLRDLIIQLYVQFIIALNLQVAQLFLPVIGLSVIVNNSPRAIPS